MNAVIVWIGSTGFSVRLGVLPAGRRTTMVSPIARDEAEDDGRDDAGERGRKDDPLADLRLGRSECVGALAEPLGTARIASSETVR